MKGAEDAERAGFVVTCQAINIMFKKKTVIPIGREENVGKNYKHQVFLSTLLMACCL